MGDVSGDHHRIDPFGRNPRWSPDGRRVLFVDDGVVFVVNSDGSDLITLVRRGAHPRWSPGGKRIAFDHSDSIRVLKVESLETHTIAQGCCAAWAPDGNTILYQDRNRHNVHAIDPSGQNQRTVISTSGAWLSTWTNPISPSSDQFLVIRGDDGDFDVQIASVSGGELITIGSGGYTPSWSPEGTKIVYTFHWNGSTGSENIGLYITDPSGNEVIRLLEGNANWLPGQPSWSPDGREIVFDAWTFGEVESRDIYVVDRDGNNLRKLTEGFRPVWGPQSIFGSGANSLIELRSWGEIKASR